MRILFVTPAFSPFPGGGERYVQSLALQLHKLGHDLTIVTSGAQGEREFWLGDKLSAVRTETVDGIHVIRCPVKSFPGGRSGLHAWRKCMVLLSALPGDQSRLLSRMARNIPPIRGLDRALDQLTAQFEVVHGFNASWEHALIAGWRYAHRQAIPFVVTPFAHFAGGKRDRLALNTTMDHQRRIMSDADALLTLTSLETDRLRQHGVLPRLSGVIGGGLGAIPASLNAHDVIAKFGLTRPYALFIGRASYDKGALHAIEAIMRIQQQGMNLTLVLIGQSTPEFDKRYARLSESEKEAVRPVGVLSENEKHSLLEGSTMLVLPSRSDSFGLVFLEAWAHGKPVIGADAGGIPEVVDDEQNGLLVKFGGVSSLSRSLERLLEDDELRRKLGEAGRLKVAQQYTWRRVAERVLENYNRVLAKR